MTNLPPVSHYGQNRAVLFGHLGVLVQGGAASTILLQHQHATALYLLSACLSLPTEFIYISHTLNFPQSHFVCIYIVREISRVALIFFFFLMCFQPFSVYLLYSVSSFMQRSVSVLAIYV